MPNWFNAFKRRIALYNKRRLYRRHQRRRIAYAAWCERHDAPDAATFQTLRARFAAIAPEPVRLVTVAGPTQQGIDATLASLQAQLHSAWRLEVLAVAGAGTEAVAAWRTNATGEPRVVVIEAAEAALGTVLRVGSDGMVALVDPGEVWRPHALGMLVEALGVHPGAIAAYGDEDQLDASGNRTQPWFKGNFDRDGLLAVDLLGSPCLWRAEALAHRLARSGDAPLERGAERHDLVLRATQGAASCDVVHVPHVLLHQGRPHGIDAAAAARAVQRHLKAAGEHGTAAPDPEAAGLVRVHFAPPEPAPWLTIVIPTRNGLALLRRCVESILGRSTWTRYDIVIIDNGSDDPACLAWMTRIAREAPNGRVQVRRDPQPFNFAALNNDAIAQARGDFVALVNNDIEVITPGWIEEMLSLAARPGVGAVGARLWYGDRTLQHGGVIVGIGGAAGHALKRLTRAEPGPALRAWRMQGYLAVTAACVVVRKAHYLAVGGMDAAAFAVAFNDVDLCLKLAAAGLRNLWTPHAELFHHESVSRGRDHDPAKKRRLQAEYAALRARWPAWIDSDPFYSPQLTVLTEDFALADPPRLHLLHGRVPGEPLPALGDKPD
jgi:O-antigen biosynthesis protein